MTMCKINLFQIGDIWIDEAYKKRQSSMIGPSHPDKIQAYTVTDCSLTKELLKPNELAFTLRRDQIKKTEFTRDYSVVKELLGQDVHVQVVTQSPIDSTLEFSGVINQVSVKGLNINCIAYSEDYKLQNTPRCRCFIGKTLFEIVDEVASDIDREITIHELFKDYRFPIIVQYNESDYDFLVRLAKRFGVFMYHDSEKLVFGSITDNQKDLSSSSFATSYQFQAGDPNLRFLAHHYVKNQVLESNGHDYSDFMVDGLVETATEASTEFDQGMPFRFDNANNLPDESQEEFLERYSLMMMGGELCNMVTCQFVCYNLDLEVGDVVTIDGNGKVVVTSVHLTWDCNGFPQNEVTAIIPFSSASLDDIIAPYVDFNAYPKSSSQTAVVVNNHDPLNMGRVQVQFLWQQDPASEDEKEKLPWIRIAQPYGGSQNKDDDKGKGFYILPEVGEEVMVGFEHDNIEKPFVIGTLYHDSDDDKKRQMPATSWVETDQANKNNEVKAFRTKKGHTIEIHDVDGDDKYGFIRIYGNGPTDKPDYDIILSTDPIKDKDYTIESASICKDEGKDNYKIDKLRVLVRSNGGDIMLDAGDGDIVMNAMNIRLHTQQDLTSYIAGKEVITVEDTHYLETKDLGLYVKKDREVLIEEKDDYTSKNLVFAVSEDCKFSADSLSAETKKTEINTTDLNVDASQSANITAKTSIALNSSGTAKLSAKTGLSLETNSKGELKAGTIDINGTIVTNLKGKVVNIQADLEGNRKGIWKDA